MGIVEQHLEMLFISNTERGKGLGKELLQYGMEQYSVNDLAVNEQTLSRKVSMNIWDLQFIKEQSWTNKEIPTHYCI